jgi:protein TonB
VTEPKESHFLSDKNRHFDRQSMARTVARFQKSTPPISLSDLGAFAKGHHPLKVAGQLAQNKKFKTHQMAARSSTNDYVEKIPLGDLTYLNTAQYKYYGFFYRIRQRLEQFWGKTLEEKVAGLMKLGRRIRSGENLITTLTVILSEVGEILTILIKGSSGVQELDDAAKNSFEEAGPFPHPPRGLVHNGRVKIEWGFIVNPR